MSFWLATVDVFEFFFQVDLETSLVDLSVPSEASDFKEQADMATLIFVLSAIHPDKHAIAARNMCKYIKVRIDDIQTYILVGFDSVQNEVYSSTFRKTAAISRITDVSHWYSTPTVRAHDDQSRSLTSQPALLIFV